MTDKLKKTFDLPSEQDMEDTYSYLKSIEIPEDPELKDIAMFALEAYKSQMTLIEHIEPKYRQRYMEVANQFLVTARDALSKARELDQKQMKIDYDQGDKKEPEKEEGTVDRKSLMREKSQLRSVK